MDFPLARQFFYQEVNQPDEQIHLERAALYLAQEEYPDLDVDAYLNALDTMAMEVEERLPSENYPLKILQTINQYLYKDLGYRGNTDDYYDPRNSFLNQVIDRRTGIPITLSLVYLAIAQRIGFPMVGIGMPGHFLIRPDVEAMEIFVDPFNQGEILFMHDCQDRLNQMFGRPITLQPEFFKSVAPPQVLARMLTNLKVIYLEQSNLEKALAAIERILLVFPNAPLELRDRGLLYYRLRRLIEARKDLEDYLTLVPDAEDTPIIEEIIEQILRSRE
jgi:regulator of sirC expression with transglutaminase-like and TPR domain